MQNDTIALKNIHTARGEVYAFLSRLFGNIPNDSLFGMLKEISPKLSFIAESSANEDIVCGVKGMENFLCERISKTGSELAAFDLENSRNYTTLFCLTKSIPAEESIFTSAEHRERQKPYDEMRVLFSKYGIKKTADIPENEDFISYELLFVSKLAHACGILIERGDVETYRKYLSEQYAFHCNHFDKWVFKFFRGVERFGIDSELLYKSAARFARGFIGEDKLALSELLET
jgi:TorA maturation chaperone TorD